jgi:hypothetical protein
MLRCPPTGKRGVPERFYALSREQRAGLRIGPSSHRPARPVAMGWVRRENATCAPGPREVAPVARRGGSGGPTADPAATPPKHLPARPSRPREGLVRRSPPWVRTALGSTPARVQESGGCEPRSNGPCPVGLCACPR